MNEIDLYIDDLEIIDLTIDGEIYDVSRRTQEKEVTPEIEEQVVLPDEGFLLSQVTVNAIPSNYGRIAWDGTGIMVY